MTQHQLNNFCAMDYPKAIVEWKEWAVEDSDAGKNL